jgi:DNA-binding MarR family transcriptional regulator
VQTLDRLGVAEALAQLVALLPRLSPRGGLSLTATATLGELERAGPRRVTELADGQGVSQPAMTGLVRRLAAQGLVERAPDPTDGRGVLVAVTPAGAQLLARRRHARAETLAALVDRLAADDRAALAAAAPALTRLVKEGRK